MWIILKFKKNALVLLEEGLRKKLGSDYKLYIPKIRFQKYKNNKLINKGVNLLGDYLFCYHESFKNIGIVNSIKFVKGLKYFLNGFSKSQEDIKKFIQECKNSENQDGFISRNFFDFVLKKNYKCLNGPFTNQIIQILEVQKNKIKLLTGNITASIQKRNLLLLPV